MTPAQKQAIRKYKRETIVRFTLELNRRTDKDILEWLDTIPNMTRAIKAAIRKQIKYSNNPPGIAPKSGSGGDDE